MVDIILCSPSDPRLGLAWELFDQTGGFEQSAEGPVMVVITQHTSNAKCARLAERFSIEVSRLTEFRDSVPRAGRNG